MRQYKSLFKIRFINSLQYRTAAIAGVITQFAFGLMYIMLFKAFYAQGNIPNNFTETQMVSYIWLQQMLLVLFWVAAKNSTIVLQIEQGNICYELVRPMNLYNNWFTTMLADGMSKTFLRLIPVMIFAFMLPAGWGLMLPASIPALLLFLVNMIIGAMLVVAINMLCYCLMFNTMSSIGIFSIVSTLASLFNGSMIPVPLMPVWFQKVLDFLPFRYINDLTFRTYIGSLTINESLIQTGIQLAWLIVFITIGKLWLNKNLKKVEVQGG